MNDRPEVLVDQKVRYYIYDQTIKTGNPPTLVEAGAALGMPPADTRASFERLAAAHMVVLQAATGEVIMANPFSAVPTPFLVRVGDNSYFGNCIWDAMGIPAMLKQDALIKASCGDCGTAMSLRIKSGLLEQAEGLAHFAIPAAHWWDDIVFN